MMQSSNGTDLHHQQSPHHHHHHPHQSPHHHPWMAMQYPTARMAMQYQMMPQHYPPQFIVYPQQQHQLQQQQQQKQQGDGNGNSSEENKTIWIGDLHYWMDENYLHSCFAHSREITSIKVIRNKQTGQSEGYGFAEFVSHTDAENVLNNYSGTAMLNTDQPFKLNWASFSMGDRRTDMGSDRSIFVGDLASDVTDTLLQETFASKYPSVKGAKVVMDANTGRSKGYGFVRFGDDTERSRAMTEMNGAYCSSRPMRIGLATPRKSAGYQQGGYASNGTSAQGLQSDGDSTNTTIFVGGLDASVTEEDLRQTFSQNGEIVNVKIPVGKGCGFVQFSNRSSAEEALQKLNGTLIGKQTVRLSWGRNPANNKQFRASEPPSPWNGGYYGQAYEGYGYAAALPQDQSMYAAAAPYGAYSLYGNNQQVS